ncbi:putative ferric-chelate reductase 1 homolog [Lycorma delicatula]|uniref:putative ferric-chelate reductase 1 homolog n=1 Tax=Lycorma delicatula TaxID=130591 RepID=UPI003F50FE27
MKTFRRRPFHGIVLWFIFQLIKDVNSYSNGAPTFVCQSMIPGHGVSAQNSVAPYSITPAQPQTEGSKVKLMLTSPSKEEFTGFLVQGRTSATSNNTIGSFISLPEDAKTIDCNNIKGSAATQSNNSKRNSVELEWEAPPDYDGSVTFLATVVKNKQTFWVGIESAPVHVKRSADAPSSGISTTFPPVSPVLSEIFSAEQDIYSGCGKTKNCLGLPEGCISVRNCTTAVSVRPLGLKYQFDMIAKQSEYVAFALSDDQLMGADNVVECIHDGANGVKAYRSWNVANAKKNMREYYEQTGFSLVTGSYADGYIYCRILHDSLNTLNDITFDLENNPYYLLLAAGSSLKPNSVGYHDIARGSTADSRKLSDLRAVVPHDPIYDDCNVLKNCFGYPDDCINDESCTGIVTVLVEGGRYQFELKGKTSGYIAVGLSNDTMMGGDSVMECVYDPNSPSSNIKLFMSWNRPGEKSNTRNKVKQTGVNLLSSSYEDGNIYCKFTRDVKTTVEGKIFDLANDKYYLLLAAGSAVKSEHVRYHDIFATSSGQLKALSDVGSFGAASKLYIRLHGAFMIAAWIGFASLGIVLARYFKQTWVGVSHCGKDVWFAWHRFFMILTWLLTIAGFVLIFVEIGEWVQGSSQTHAILGVVASVLCFIQPFMAAFRPHPGGRRRPLFNWLHWLVGNTAHIFAIVAIFLAVQLKKAELPDWMDWILVAFVAFYVLVHLILSLFGCISERQGAKRINAFPMNDMHTSRSPLNNMDRKRDGVYSGFRKFILFLHFVVIIALSTVLILIVVLAPIERQWTSLQNKWNM